jgi:hypothetical protein
MKQDGIAKAPFAASRGFIWIAADNGSNCVRLGGGLLALALSLVGSPAVALLCSTANPTVVPGGTVLGTIPSSTINSILGLTATPPFLSGSTSFVMTNSQPFIAARTFVFDPTQPQSGAVGSFLLPLAQLRGLTQAQYLNFFALPNTPPIPRNNGISLVLVPAGTQFWSGPTGPITGPTGLFWGTGGGLQYFVGKQVTGSFQVPSSNYVFPTFVGGGGPVLTYAPRLTGNAQAIGGYLDQQCVPAYSDLDRVLTSLDVLNLGSPTDPRPLAAAVGQLSPDRYGALPLIIMNQHTLVLDAFGGRIDATRWPSFGFPGKQYEIAPGTVAWARAVGELGQRGDTSTMTGYRTTAGGVLGGVGYQYNNGTVFGIGGGYLTSKVSWEDIGGSSGNVSTGVVGAYGGTTLGPVLLDGAVAGTFSSVDVNRQIAIANAGLGVPGLSTAIFRTANGITDASGIAARLDFGTNLKLNEAILKPFVGLSYSWLDRLGFTEANAGSIDLTVNNQISDGLRSRLGAFAYYPLYADWGLQGNVVWTHRLAASSGDITAGLAGQLGSFTIKTMQDDEDSLQPGLALIGRFATGQVYARYDGDFRQNFQSHAVTVGVDYRF